MARRSRSLASSITRTDAIPTEKDNAIAKIVRPSATLDVERRRGSLKVLLVSYAFPPANIIGAVRVGKFAKYLHQAGHQVRVVAAPTMGDNSLALEIPPEHVVNPAGWASEVVFDNLVKRVRRVVGNSGSGSPAATAKPPIPRSRGMSAALTRHCHALLRIPDARRGWIRAAAAAGTELARDWRPDVIVASAPPYSGLVAAARIARACGAPWIAELRDLWADNPYYAEPRWRLWLDRMLERHILGSAAGLVTVTPGWAATLRLRHHQKVACIFNGYAEEDFPAERLSPPPGEVVSIVYTGNIYVGYRDPSPLFQAIALLGRQQRDRVAVHFYGPDENQVKPMATLNQVADRVFIHDRVAYKASLALQVAADVLLLMQWNHRKDQGNIPAKFFEYLGTRRPILMIGYESGDLAQIIRERKAGFVSSDPAAIARQLQIWLAQRPGGISPVEPTARAGMTRAEQFQQYERFLIEILDGP